VYAVGCFFNFDEASFALIEASYFNAGGWLLGIECQLSKGIAQGHRAIKAQLEVRQHILWAKVLGEGRGGEVQALVVIVESPQAIAHVPPKLHNHFLVICLYPGTHMEVFVPMGARNTLEHIHRFFNILWGQRGEGGLVAEIDGRGAVLGGVGGAAQPGGEEEEQQPWGRVEQAGVVH